jgi:hypothetical protein
MAGSVAGLGFRDGVNNPAKPWFDPASFATFRRWGRMLDGS